MAYNETNIGTEVQVEVYIFQK